MLILAAHDVGYPLYTPVPCIVSSKIIIVHRTVTQIAGCGQLWGAIAQMHRCLYRCIVASLPTPTPMPMLMPAHACRTDRPITSHLDTGLPSPSDQGSRGWEGINQGSVGI